MKHEQILAKNKKKKIKPLFTFPLILWETNLELIPLHFIIAKINVI